MGLTNLLTQPFITTDTMKTDTTTYPGNAVILHPMEASALAFALRQGELLISRGGQIHTWTAYDCDAKSITFIAGADLIAVGCEDNSTYLCIRRADATDYLELLKMRFINMEEHGFAGALAIWEQQCPEGRFTGTTNGK